ncbi:MAG: hypothetical protein Q8M15_16325 [Bacteroidota bacterium]|nr:hypothetical protein [Bacteroidota bacterium]
MQSPVLLIIFNRSDTALMVIEQLRAAAINKLYIYCDGPRLSTTGEAELLLSVQKSIIKSINWPCEIKTNFNTNNEGPRLAIGHAINWFFEHEEEGIILEHDCVPSVSFFGFCKDLLNHYRNDERIMHISGDNFQFGKTRGNGSYYFSKLNHIWGFATWKRAWQHYDVDMKNFELFKKEQKIKSVLNDKRSQKIWMEIFEKTYRKEIRTWDYQWTFAMWCNNGLAILPNVNLVSNIGFDSQALNTTDPNHILANLQRAEIETINHPTFILADSEADKFATNDVFNPTLLKFALRKFRKP